MVSQLGGKRLFLMRARIRMKDETWVIFLGIRVQGVCVNTFIGTAKYFILSLMQRRAKSFAARNTSSFFTKLIMEVQLFLNNLRNYVCCIV